MNSCGQWQEPQLLEGEDFGGHRPFLDLGGHSMTQRSESGAEAGVGARVSSSGCSSIRETQSCPGSVPSSWRFSAAWQ